MSSTNKTTNYNLSQFNGTDHFDPLIDYNADITKIDAALKAIKDESDAAVPNTRKIAGLAMDADITLAELIAAGLCPAPESGTWTPTLYGMTTAGTPTYTSHTGSYYKIGKLVIIQFSLRISSKGGMAGSACIGGLPFSATYGTAKIHDSSGTSVLSGWVFSSGAIGWAGITLQRDGSTGVNAIDASEIADNFLTYGSYGYYICQ